jgi:predicted O-methyltransferase YrrM
MEVAHPLVFDSSEVFERIWATCRIEEFDMRRLLLPDLERDYDLKMSHEFMRGYMTVKYAIAKVLNPGTILEIGVSSGMSAMAFLAACPEAHYTGIDNGADDWKLVERARELLAKQERSFAIIPFNSQELKKLPGGAYDLIHVDGCHLRECAKHDVLLAWEAISLNGYILVDDTRDTAVAAGTFDALAEINPGSVDWCYLNDTWTGNILIHRSKSRP